MYSTLPALWWNCRLRWFQPWWVWLFRYLVLHKNIIWNEESIFISYWIFWQSSNLTEVSSTKTLSNYIRHEFSCWKYDTDESEKKIKIMCLISEHLHKGCFLPYKHIVQKNPNPLLYTFGISLDFSQLSNPLQLTNIIE